MKFEVAIAIGIGWFIFRAITRFIKKTNANLQQGGQNSTISPNSQEENIQSTTSGSATEQSRTPRNMEYEGQSRTYTRLEEIENKQNVIDPFKEPQSLENSSGNHYNEEVLVTQYDETHRSGKTVAHHKHKLFDEKKDRNKSVHLKGNTGKAQQSKASSITKQERRVKKQHPMAAVLQSKGGRKQAVIMAEILKRPEEW